MLSSVLLGGCASGMTVGAAFDNSDWPPTGTSASPKPQPVRDCVLGYVAGLALDSIFAGSILGVNDGDLGSRSEVALGVLGADALIGGVLALESCPRD